MLKLSPIKSLPEMLNGGLDSLTKHQFWLLITVIVVFGALIRFWNLGQFNQLVFDEVYFPKFAYNYLSQEPFFHVHPPLGKYTQALGIWIYNHLPWVNDPEIGTVELAQLSAESWRWVNALFGSLVPLIIAHILMTLTKNRAFAALAALFVVVDGSLIVASRYGLSNIQIVFFGALSLLFLAKALKSEKHHRLWLIACGIGLGCTVSIKWNGLAYSLISWAMLIGGTLALLMEKLLNRLEKISHPSTLISSPSNIYKKIHIAEYPAYLMLIPVLVYSLMWIPDLNWNSRHAQYGFVGMHKQMTGYHGSTIGADAHPYCSVWHEWPIMKRPISYYFSKKQKVLDDGTRINVVQDVHLFGNPILYWLSLVALTWVFIRWLYNLVVWLRLSVLKPDFLITSFIALGYGANFFPWMLVSRCKFFYHYQSASVFSFLALAWVTGQLFSQRSIVFKIIGGAIVLAVLSGFIYWLPIQLGIPLPSKEYYERMWFNSWI